MAHSVLACEALLFRLGAVALLHFAVPLDHHLPALRPAEGLGEQTWSNFVPRGCLNGSNQEGCTKFDISMPPTGKVMLDHLR
jgi:hypothetical protein